MQMFEYKNLTIRLTDQRPKAPYIQVNIYNPDDAGHSLCCFAATIEQTEDQAGTPSDLAVVFDMIVASGTLDEMVQRALSGFTISNPQE